MKYYLLSERKYMKLFDKFINSISYTARHEKALSESNDKVDKYLKMDENEFTMEYIDIKSRYKHKQTLLSVISVATLIVITLDIWKYFFNAISVLSINDGMINSELSKTSLYLALTIICVIVFTVVFIIGNMVRSLHQLSKELLFLEEVKGMRNAKK